MYLLLLNDFACHTAHGHFPNKDCFPSTPNTQQFILMDAHNGETSWFTDHAEVSAHWVKFPNKKRHALNWRGSVLGEIIMKLVRSLHPTHQTTPYAPFPIGLMGRYFAGHSNRLPHTCWRYNFWGIRNFMNHDLMSLGGVQKQENPCQGNIAGAHVPNTGRKCFSSWSTHQELVVFSALRCILLLAGCFLRHRASCCNLVSVICLRVGRNHEWLLWACGWHRWCSQAITEASWAGVSVSWECSDLEGVNYQTGVGFFALSTLSRGNRYAY